MNFTCIRIKSSRLNFFLNHLPKYDIIVDWRRNLWFTYYFYILQQYLYHYRGKSHFTSLSLWHWNKTFWLTNFEWNRFLFVNIRNCFFNSVFILFIPFALFNKFKLVCYFWGNNIYKQTIASFYVYTMQCKDHDPNLYVIRFYSTLKLMGCIVKI